MKKNKSPVLGIGTDIVEIDRMHQIIDRHGYHLLNRLFTMQEQDYCLRYKDPVPHFAGRFAGKEAIVKALGSGFGSTISWLNVEILQDNHNKPIVYLSSHLIIHFNNPNLFISISHCEKYAHAIAIWTI